MRVQPKSNWNTATVQSILYRTAFSIALAEGNFMVNITALLLMLQWSTSVWFLYHQHCNNGSKSTGQLPNFLQIDIFTAGKLCKKKKIKMNKNTIPGPLLSVRFIFTSAVGGAFVRRPDVRLMSSVSLLGWLSPVSLTAGQRPVRRSAAGNAQEKKHTHTNPHRRRNGPEKTRSHSPRNG